MKKDFVMLLINLKICRIDECEEINERINSAVDKDMRENFDDVIDREITSIHDIDFEDEKTDDEINV